MSNPLRRFPSSFEKLEMTKWFKDHPEPGSDASPIAIRAYYSDLLAETNRWASERTPEALRKLGSEIRM